MSRAVAYKAARSARVSGCGSRSANTRNPWSTAVGMWSSKKPASRRLPFHHPDQDALDGDQTRRMRADVQRILVANPPGIVRQKLPGVADRLLAGDLEVTGRTGKIVRRGPFGEVISGSRPAGDDHLDGDRRGQEPDQPRRFGPA